MKSRFLHFVVVTAAVSALTLGTTALLSWRVNAAEGATHVPVPVSINAVCTENSIQRKTGQSYLACSAEAAPLSVSEPFE